MSIVLSGETKTDLEELKKLMRVVDTLSVNDVLKLLGPLFDEDFRRIRKWR